MKIYTDKLPKNCWECPCFTNDLEQSCGLDDEDKGYFLDEIDGGECPLKTIQSVQNQKAVEVLEKVKQSIADITAEIIYQDSRWLGKQAIYDKIDQLISELGGKK